MSVVEEGHNFTNCQSGHTTTFAVMMYLDDFDVRFQSFYSKMLIQMFVKPVVSGLRSLCTPNLKLACFLLISQNHQHFFEK